jgi:hypothetical protein
MFPDYYELPVSRRNGNKASRSRSICSDVGIYDRVVIQDILKEIAQTQQVDLNAKQKFKGPSFYPLPLHLDPLNPT